MKKISRHEKALAIKGKSGKTIRNPNEIVVNQHIIPRIHILEWSTDGKLVTVCDISSGEEKPLAASNPYFCVMRLWDQWTEVNMLGPNERNYQEQLYLLKKKKPFTHHEHILAYYIMLCVRTWVANKKRPDYPSTMTNLSYVPTKSELEENELEMVKTGVHVVKGTSDESSQYMARQVVKMSMSQAYIQWCLVLKGQQWNIFHSKVKSFVLPDSLYENFQLNLHILPVCPNYVLIAKTTYQHLVENNCLEVDFINKSLIENAIKFYVSI